MPRTYDAKLSKTISVNPEVVRTCHVCQKPTKNLDYSICNECREAILFAKELKAVLVDMKTMREYFYD